jgi:Fuc2NAc and GlcNAc transferase
MAWFGAIGGFEVTVLVWWLFFVSGLSALLLTGVLRRYALARRLMDVPNERSSHKVPTPRGGGLAVVLTCVISLLLLGWLGWLPTGDVWALVGAGGWVALVGWLDDHGHVPARWRLLAHFIGAVWALSLIGGLPPLQIFGAVWDLGWLGHGLAVIYLVWLLNLYNFMDGIDGIAGIEAVTVCMGSILIYLASPATESVWMAAGILLAAMTGFLFWNFPKAKIFMGDAGSGFVGIVLGVLSIQSAWSAPELFWSWVILLGAFVVDATVTLVRRILRGVAFYEAHRSHAYQYASRKFSAHPPVSMAFGIINLFWLSPIALLVAVGWLDGVLGVLVAYWPLVWLAVRFKAGAAETQEV